MRAWVMRRPRERDRDRSFLVLSALVMLLYWTLLINSYYGHTRLVPQKVPDESATEPLSAEPKTLVQRPKALPQLSKSLSSELHVERGEDVMPRTPKIEDVDDEVGDDFLPGDNVLTLTEEESEDSYHVNTDVYMPPRKPAHKEVYDIPPKPDEEPPEEIWAGSEVIINDEKEDLSKVKRVRVKLFPLVRRDNRKYFFYQPSGGFGNQRLILRWAMIVANAMNRTLAVAPLAAHSDIWHGYNQWRKDEVIPAYKVLDAAALEEAIDQGVVFLEDIPARIVDYMRNKSSYSVKVHVKGHYVNQNAAKKKLLVYRESEIANTWRQTKEDVIFWDKMSMWQCCSPDFSPDSIWYGRHIMFNTEFKLIAKRLMAMIGQYNAVHVRRGDMTISRDRRTADVYYRAHHLERFDHNLPLYIATNEKDKSWFDSLKSPGRFTRLLFWEDLDQTLIEGMLAKYPSVMKGDVLGFIDMLICGNAVMWEGSRKSTFSASISAIRMAPQLRSLTWQFPPKPSVRKALGIKSVDDEIDEEGGEEA